MTTWTNQYTKLLTKHDSNYSNSWWNHGFTTKFFSWYEGEKNETLWKSCTTSFVFQSIHSMASRDKSANFQPNACALQSEQENLCNVNFFRTWIIQGFWIWISRSFTTISEKDVWCCLIMAFGYEKHQQNYPYG